MALLPPPTKCDALGQVAEGPLDAMPGLLGVSDGDGAHPINGVEAAAMELDLCLLQSRVRCRKPWQWQGSRQVGTRCTCYRQMKQLASSSTGMALGPSPA